MSQRRPLAATVSSASSSEDEGWAKAAARRAPTPPKPPHKKPSNRLSILDIIRVLAGLLVLNGAASWFVTGEDITWGFKPWWLRPAAVMSYLSGPVRLTPAQLALYDGTDPSKPIYVGLNGSIYDVSASANTYGPDGSYHFFAGRDASRAFVTGCFDEDLTPDLRGVEMMFVPKGEVEGETSAERKVRVERELRVARKKVAEGLAHWEKVFSGETGRPYFWVGTIVRPEGWLDNKPMRRMCKAAEDSRPKREKKKGGK
ncbi:cytochrome b5 [Trichodelitschia bisporula]|uniref:Cytochrome b5 n=1 Tax=Trichodelitschia bisporula TaxID=703511 RepID=A0A6G1HJA4_9PEZI|nr:cytochrome b5 [Trichodelitschia bisporula]